MSLLTPQLLAQLLDAHANALALFAAQWSQSPADVVQDAFVELAGQPVLPQNVLAWLYRVVRNRAISDARSAARRRRRESKARFRQTGRGFAMAGDVGFDPGEATDALSELPEESREVVIARVWGKLTFEEIGEITATSASTAFRRYEAAILLLPKTIGNPMSERPDFAEELNDLPEDIRKIERLQVGCSQTTREIEIDRDRVMFSGRPGVGVRLAAIPQATTSGRVRGCGRRRLFARRAWGCSSASGSPRTAARSIGRGTRGSRRVTATPLRHTSPLDATPANNVVNTAIKSVAAPSTAPGRQLRRLLPIPRPTANLG